MITAALRAGDSKTASRDTSQQRQEVRGRRLCSRQRLWAAGMCGSSAHVPARHARTLGQRGRLRGHEGGADVTRVELMCAARLCASV
eukprot:2889436-Rhodomonas_salina.2